MLVCGTAYCLQDIKSVHRSRDAAKDSSSGLSSLSEAGTDTSGGGGLAVGAGSGSITSLSATLVFPTYVIMFLIFIPFLACRRGENSLLNVMRGRGVKYFVVAAIDVEANYLILHAYKYTTLPSVQVRASKHKSVLARCPDKDHVCVCVRPLRYNSIFL